MDHTFSMSPQILFSLERQIVEFGASAHITILPEEILEMIFSYLDVKSLLSASQCCHYWYEISNNNKLWQHFCKIRQFINIGKRAEYLLSKQIGNPPKLGCTFLSPPTFTFSEANKPSSLPDICYWKMIFMKAKHLRYNWKSSRYEVHLLNRVHNSPVTAIDSDGKILISSSADCTLAIWNLQEKSAYYCHRPEKQKTKDWKSFGVQALWEKLGKLNIFNYENLPELKQKYLQDAAAAIKILDNVAIFCSITNKILSIDIRNGNVIRYYTGSPASSLHHLEFSGTWIASAGEDGCVAVWDWNRSNIRISLTGHNSDVECTARCNDLLCTGACDGSLILWDMLDEGKIKHNLIGHTDMINCVKCNEKRVHSGSSDETVRVWCVKTGACLLVLADNTSDIYCLDVDQRHIVAGSSNGVVTVWSPDGDLLHLWKGEHIGAERFLRVDGGMAVSAGDQRQIIVWDLVVGARQNIVHRQPYKIRHLWFDESKIITSSSDQPGSISLISYW